MHWHGALNQLIYLFLNSAPYILSYTYMVGQKFRTTSDFESKNGISILEDAKASRRQV